MATYWVDPYIETPIGGGVDLGGINGTTIVGGTWSTGNQTGSYTQPYALGDLEDATVYNAFADGDLILFKGLAEATFFPPGNQTSSASTTYTNFYVNSGDNAKTFKYTNYWGESEYWTTRGGGNLYVSKFDGSSTWTGPMIQPQDDNYIPLHSDYANTKSKTYNLFGTANFTTEVIIRAGFTTELEGTNNTPTGITVLSFGDNGRVNMGAQNTSYDTNMIGKGIDLDCRNTMIYTSSQNTGTVYWRVKEFRMRSWLQSPYSTGGNVFIHHYGNTFDVGTLFGSGGYQNIYFIGQGTINMTVNNMSSGYNNQSIFFYNDNTFNTLQNVVFNIKRCLFYDDFSVQWNQARTDDNLTWNFNTNYHYVSKNTEYQWYLSGTNNTNATQVIENFNGNPDTDTSYSTNSTVLDNMNNVQANLGLGSNSRTILTTTVDIDKQLQTKFLNYSVIASNMDSSIYKNFNTDVTYENLQYCNFVNNNATSLVYGNPNKFYVISNSKDGRPISLVPPTEQKGNFCWEYISKDTNFLNSKVWHFVKACAGVTYSDTIHHNLPSYASNNIDYDYTYKCTDGADITLNVKIYGHSPVGGFFLLRDLTPTIDTAPSGYDQFVINETLTKAELSKNIIKSIHTLVSVTPNSTTTVNVITMDDATVALGAAA